MDKVKDKAEWIKPSEAVRMLENLYSGSTNAKELIADKLKDGEIKATAKFYWTSSCKNRRKIFEAGPPNDAETDIILRNSIFIGSSSFVQDVTRWKWKSANFIVIHKKKGDRILNHVFTSVKFRAEDIQELVSTKLEADRKRGKGGRRFKEEQWRMLWTVAIRRAQEGTLTADRVGPKKAFSKQIFDSYREGNPDPLGFHTVERQLNAAYDHLFPTVDTR